MPSLPKLSFLFKTTYRPNGAVYYGVHESEDFSFGTDQYTDPYIGNGSKLLAVIKESGNNRRLFHVQVIKVSTPKDVDASLKKILADLDYSDPKCLNAREGYPRGRPQSQEQIRNAAAARNIIGNKNAAGKVTTIDIDLPNPDEKLKWCHAPDNSDEKIIVVDKNDKPIKKGFEDWIIGRMSKNPYVQARITEIEAQQKKEEETED